MFHRNQYRLLDFGDDQKLEVFGPLVVARETPSAIGTVHRHDHWRKADLVCRQQGDKKSWDGHIPDDWSIQFGDTSLTFELRATPTGQVGLFPEQAVNWDWILSYPNQLVGAKALNLFAYTGGTTMALAAIGASVVHLDAASSVVQWARANASRSGMTELPIRWIVEDASRFLSREIKRGNRYDILVADPPSFGRGPSGETWKLERDLPDFLLQMKQILSNTPKMIIVSCHTPGVDARRLKSMCERVFPSHGILDAFEMSLDVDPLDLNSDQHESNPAYAKQSPEEVHSLASGCCVRWISSELV